MSKFYGLSRRALLFTSVAYLATLGPTALSRSAAAQDVRIMLDWLIQGTHAPFFIAETKGYYKAEGLNVSIDSGKGATNVAVAVAGGAYQFGMVDVPTLINFNAKNPKTPLVAVYIYFDSNPLAIVSRKSAGINEPADLNGKKVAGGPGTAVYDTINLLTKSSPDIKINWVPVSPALFAPMLLRGEVDGIGGFINSMVPAALEAGLKREDISALRYSDFGVNLYGMALVTSRQYADASAATVKGVIKAVNRGLLDTIANPDEGLKILKARDLMMNLDIEKIRLGIALELINTPHVAKDGLSSVTEERLQKTIDDIVRVNKIDKAPTRADIYDDKFLPPIADRMIRK
jgi:NitT/TauT family transport system substrate-binding protein